MKHFIAATTLSIFSLSSPLAAQDWSGPYAGINLSSTKLESDHEFSNGAPSDTASASGTVPGLFLGYNLQRGKLVFGAEVELQAGSVSGSFDNASGIGSSGSVKAENQKSVRAIIGFAGKLGTADTLFYGAVGATTADFEFRGGPSSFDISDNGYDKTLTGTSFGLGMDTRLDDKITMRAEYRRTNFEETEGPLSPAFSSVEMPAKVSQNQFTLGLRMDF